MAGFHNPIGAFRRKAVYKNDIAVAGRLGIAATTLEGVLAVKGHGTPGHAGH